MYFRITATPSNGRPPIHESGVSLVETMMYTANSMLQHLDVPSWTIQVEVDDPEQARAELEVLMDEQRIADEMEQQEVRGISAPDF